MGVEKAQLFKISKNSTLENSKLAVIFIHGIRGHMYDTWRKNPDSLTLMELFDTDPDLQEKVDFYSYGYRTGFKPQQYDFQAAADLLYSDIQAQLPKVSIIFVAHSMGGLIVQQYIVNRYQNFDDVNLKFVKGVVYLSVPFRGSGLAKLIPRWLANKQIKSLIRDNKDLYELERNWNKYVYRGGIESLPPNLKHNISQISIRGERDRVVAKLSATPLCMDENEVVVDEGHSSICKVDQHSTVYKTILNFLCERVESEDIENEITIMNVNGYKKQQYEGKSHIELDWTDFFDIETSPRKLPSTSNWDVIKKSLVKQAAYWSEHRLPLGNLIRISGNLCLSGGVLVGNQFSKASGAILEIRHYGENWSSLKSDSLFEVDAKEILGNDSNQSLVILTLSVSNDIERAVLAHLEENDVKFAYLINMIPKSGACQGSIKNAEQAVSYAIAVKKIMDQVKQQGVKKVDLYLNCPLSVAIFVGHYLTAVSPVQIYDFANPGYVLSCRI